MPPRNILPIQIVLISNAMECGGSVTLCYACETMPMLETMLDFAMATFANIFMSRFNIKFFYNVKCNMNK